MSRKEKNIMVTGCSSGIGRCVAMGLHQRGYRVFATARRDEDLAALRSAGLHPIRLELADSASIASAVAEVLAASNGALFGLVNNAAYGQPGAVEDLPRAVLRQQFEVNLFGTHELTTRLIPVMRGYGEGRIVQISSVLGLVALPYRGAYVASKFALEGLTDTLRLELAGSGVQVSLIEPGPIRSRFRANAYAMYKQHIDAEHSAHREIYAGLERRLTKVGPAAPFTLPPEAVLAKVIHALESPRPRPRYAVTVPTHLFAAARRLLPGRWLDRVMQAVGRSENR